MLCQTWGSRDNQGCPRLWQLSRWGWGSALGLSWVGIPVLSLTVCHGRCPYPSEPYFPHLQVVGLSA